MLRKSKLCPKCGNPDYLENALKCMCRKCGYYVDKFSEEEKKKKEQMKL